MLKYVGQARTKPAISKSKGHGCRQGQIVEDVAKAIQPNIPPESNGHHADTTDGHCDVYLRRADATEGSQSPCVAPTQSMDIAMSNHNALTSYWLRVSKGARRSHSQTVRDLGM